MNADRLTITLDAKLGAAARKAAKHAKLSLSAWLAEATADRIRNEVLGQALDRFEAEDGAFTPEELAAAAAELGLAAPVPRQRRQSRRPSPPKP